MAKTVRKKSTPYPVQVAAFVKDRTSRAPFSAKDVYEQIDHPSSQKSSVVGAIHKALHRLWSDDQLCSFVDANGNVMREPTHVSHGSKAVENPQMFALPGSKAPNGFTRVSYAEAGALASASEPAVATAAANSESEPGADASDESDDGQRKDPTRRTMFGRLTEPAPDWLPDALMLDWVTRRLVLSRLREGLDKADEQEKRQLIMTGLQRKGELPTPDTPAARSLVKLCRRSAVWWDRVSLWALDDDIESGDAVDSDDLERLEDDPLDMANSYDLDAVVLACVRLGIDNDDVRLLAAEADTVQTTSPTRALEDKLAETATQLDLANQDLREARAAERVAQQARDTAEKLAKQLRGQLDQMKASSKKQGEQQEQVADLRAQLAEALEGGARLAATEEALDEERRRLTEMERDAAESAQALAKADADLVTAREEVRRLRATEPALQSALRDIGELNVQLEHAERRAGEVPIAQDARSLVGLLDSTIGRLVSEASARITQGEATDEDQLLLAFASQFLQFKIALPTPAEPEVEVTPEATSEPVELLAAADELLDEPPAIEVDMEEEPEPERERHRRRRRTRLGWSVKPLGGAGEIGASAIVAQTPSGETVLLDAGQRMPRLYGAAADYAYHFGVTGVERLDAIIVSHAHIDHTGSLPVLHRNVRSQLRLNGLPIYMSDPTRELAELMMRDSAKIQHWRDLALEDVAETDLGGEFTSGLKAAAYDDDDVSRVMEYVETRDPRAPFEIPGTHIQARMEPVAHVLGSCAIHLTDTTSGATLLYTGDLGPITDSQLTLPDFGHTSMLTPAQMIVMESTYGARPTDAPPTGRQAKQSWRERQVTKLHGLASDAIKREGVVLIPCFSLGRAQELARIIYQALNKELPDAPVYIGGMAAKILDIYDAYADRGDRGQGERWVRAGQFPRTQSLHRRVREHLTFDEIAEEVLDSGPGYVLASPAVLSGGWSKTFAERMVEDERHAIIFTGFLPNDDRHSRRLSELRKGDQVRLGDRYQTIQSDWDKVGLSAHASADDLRQFAQRMAGQSETPVAFGFVHGMPASEAALAADVGRMENVAAAEPLQNNQVWAAV